MQTLTNLFVLIFYQSQYNLHYLEYFYLENLYILHQIHLFLYDCDF